MKNKIKYYIAGFFALISVKLCIAKEVAKTAAKTTAAKATTTSVFSMSIFTIVYSVFSIPLRNLEEVWSIIPIYAEMVIGTLLGEDEMHSNSVWCGFLLLWSSADWIRYYIMKGISFSFSNLNWVIALSFGVVGLLAFIVGFSKSFLSVVFGRYSIWGYFAIAFYPLQYMMIEISRENVIAILLFSVPFIIAYESIGLLLKHRS
ncbi:hypothetical protein HYW21_01835 [Candidatus Woesearchaeota archaeon]|nr:hypothetical protein [Candidatus Woesearchaeota archaeon]